MKNLLRNLAPPLLLNATRRVRNRKYGFFGNYDSFAAAQADSAGYQSAEVVQAMAARAGDPPGGVQIDERSQHVLAAFAMIPQRPLSVLDFGGANGGYYHLLRRFIPLRWTVLETPELAAANRHRATDELSFISDVTHASRADQVVLMSGVLQYLEDPHKTFDIISRLAPFVVVNRIPLIDAARDRLTVQRVHPSMYSGSMPHWFFARDRFMHAVSSRHDIVMTWEVPQDTAVLDGVGMHYNGMLLRAR